MGARVVRNLFDGCSESAKPIAIAQTIWRLAGMHGSVAADVPRALVQRLRALEAERRAIAEALRTRVGHVVVAFNEYCAPSLEEAVGALARAGTTPITIVTTMITPGGVHSEVEIPQTVRALRGTHPDVVIRYAWPFDLDAVASLLAGACEVPTARQ